MRESRNQTDTDNEVLDSDGTLQLIMAMFRLTSQDLRYGRKDIRKEANKFLESDWFRFLCQEINLDCPRVRAVIENSSKVSFRNKYE